MPSRLRCLLHRPVNHQPDSGHAARQTCRHRLSAADERYALRNFSTAGQTRLLLRVTGIAGNVRRKPRTGNDLAATAGTRNASGNAVKPCRRKNAGRGRETQQYQSTLAGIAVKAEVTEVSEVFEVTVYSLMRIESPFAKNSAIPSSCALARTIC